MKRNYFINGELLGSIELPEPEFSAISRLFYCAICGEAYAKIPVEHQNPFWIAEKGCCQNCQPRDDLNWQIPGSIWIGRDRKWNEELPEEVLKRELQLTVNYYSKGEK